jgi:hypothetical protein
MTDDLQTGLMAIGVAFVVAVISYNKWQEYKAKKSVERAFSSEHDDVLMTPDIAAEVARHEPTFEASPAELPEVYGHANEFADEEPLYAEPAGPSEPAKVDPFEKVPRMAQKDLPVDDLIDCLIPLSLEVPVRGEKVLPRLHGLSHVGNKPVHFVGQRDDGVWEAVAHGSIYHALQAGVQLANRSSALNEIEYSELITRLRQIADELDAELDVPDMSEVMSEARALHQFVNEYDAQLSINVQSNGAPWAVDTLLAALERQGFDLRPDGKLVMPDGDGGILFSLSTNVTLAEETTSRLTLLLDVPRTTPMRDGFGAMAACARVLAGRLGGIVVDDSGQPLPQTMLEDIAQQVNAFYLHMEDAGIPAGSGRALRLF